MVKVAFWFDAPVEYTGGLNYIKNLLYALSLVNDGSVRPYVFFSADVPAEVETQFSPYATIVRTSLLQRRAVRWFVHKVLYKVFGSMVLINALLKSHGISVLSHVWFVYKGRSPFRILGWIPDFQYLHLPELFPNLDPDDETKQNRKIIAQSEIVFLSSHSAYEDFARIAPPEHRSRGRVLQFVSQPRPAESSSAVTQEALEKKYGFAGKFFFLPNQFWAHKNHMVVLRAAKMLKDRGIDILVLCTGNVRDYRLTGSAYIDTLYEFIEANDLRNQVKILGHIDYGDVLGLMKSSIAVLNPSRFEGWSSSVEEAKSIGKPVILSRIAAHREQSPANAQYFEPDDALVLSELLAAAWAAPADPSRDEAQRIAREALRARTVEFGTAYLDILNGVARKNVRLTNQNHRHVCARPKP
jgi:glycosyltransferase involved in cell wall biosynthesis